MIAKFVCIPMRDPQVHPCGIIRAKLAYVDRKGWPARVGPSGLTRGATQPRRGSPAPLSDPSRHPEPSVQNDKHRCSLGPRPHEFSCFHLVLLRYSAERKGKRTRTFCCCFFLFFSNKEFPGNLNRRALIMILLINP